MRLLLILMLWVVSVAARAETVQVKYHGPVSLASFTCSEVSERSDVSRICYDSADRYMLIRLGATYYHYCEVDSVTASMLLASTTKRKFFESRIRGSGSDGPFDCRTHPIPKKYRQ